MMCSMVTASAPPQEMVVLRAVLVTFSARASTTGPPGRSVRRNLMPWPAGAGETVMWE